jgi:hypothetical protein
MELGERYRIGKSLTKLVHMLNPESKYNELVTYFSRDYESNWLDRSTVHFVCTGNFTVRNAQRTTRKETHPALRIG